MDNSHLKYLIAALVAVNAGLGAAATELSSPLAKTICIIAATTLSAFLGIMSPGFQSSQPQAKKE